MWQARGKVGEMQLRGERSRSVPRGVVGGVPPAGELA